MRDAPKLQMVMVGQWTGRETKALRLAMRMSIRTFAEHLGVGVRTVATWESAGETVYPRPEMQEVLDAALASVNDATRARFTYQLFDDPPLTAVAVARRTVSG